MVIMVGPDALVTSRLCLVYMKYLIDLSTWLRFARDLTQLLGWKFKYH